MTAPTRRVVSCVLRDGGRMPYRDRVRMQPDPTDIDGLLAFHRATFGDTRMDGETAPPSPPATLPVTTPPAPAAPPAGYVPQDTVNATVARESEKAKTAALQALADEWGVPLDEAKQIVANHKAGEAAKLTEAEKREKAAADKEAAATARETAAVARERDATIRATLAEAGCTKDDITDAKRLVDLPDGDVDEKAVGEAVEALKKRRPELFGGKRTPTAPAGFTPPGAPTPSQTPTNMDQARERYRKQQEKSA